MIEFGENEVGMSNSIFIDNCVNLTIMVNNKVKSIFMTKCRKVNLIFNVKKNDIFLFYKKKY